MHIALLLRCSRATFGKGLSCSAPSPAGQSTAELEYTHAYCAAFSRIFLELQETKSIRISEQIRIIDHYAVEPPSEKDLCCLAPSPTGWRHCRKLSTLWPCIQSVTNKVQHLSGFQNRVELLTMHNCTIAFC